MCRECFCALLSNPKSCFLSAQKKPTPFIPRCNVYRYGIIRAVILSPRDSACRDNRVRASVSRVWIFQRGIISIYRGRNTCSASTSATPIILVISRSLWLVLPWIFRAVLLELRGWRFAHAVLTFAGDRKIKLYFYFKNLRAKTLSHKNPLLRQHSSVPRYSGVRNRSKCHGVTDVRLRHRKKTPESELRSAVNRV